MRVDKLTARGVQALLKRPGTHTDGRGLQLVIGANGRGSWVLFYFMPGTKKRRELGLGSVHDVTLAEARVRRDEARRLILNGVDPIEVKRTKRSARTVPTFAEVVDACVAARKSQWRSKHAEEWPASLNKHCAFLLGVPIDRIVQTDVLRVMTPIWTTIPITAQRVRARLEIILDYATAHGFRIGDNPAALKALTHLLPAQAHRVVHHAALKAGEMPALLAKLKAEGTPAARCLAFALLTAARSGEARGARWEEIDGTTWTVPAERMKAHKEHVVTLAEPALTLLGEPRESGLIFASQSRKGQINQSILLRLLRRLGYPEATVHGLRSTFSSWAHDKGFRFEVVELAIAHDVGSRVERSYNRGDRQRDRKVLMAHWAAHCCGVGCTDNVVPLTAGVVS